MLERGENACKPPYKERRIPNYRETNYKGKEGDALNVRRYEICCDLSLANLKRRFGCQRFLQTLNSKLQRSKLDQSSFQNEFLKKRNEKKSKRSPQIWGRQGRQKINEDGRVECDSEFRPMALCQVKRISGMLIES